ncbi:MAG: type II secretion system GspH family protein [Planctomycetes bacterium]|nr:type II secretion system GspH family protein [Planctomycetota bacterium]
MSRCRLPGGAAFTLIELLVVIAIVAVLAGMLMPALGLVQRAARTTSCQANMRQVYLAYAIYAEDWEGRLPRLWAGGVEQAQSGGNMNYRGQFVPLSEAACIAGLGWCHSPAITVCPNTARATVRNNEGYVCYQSPTYAPNLCAWNAWSQWGRPRTSHLPSGTSASSLVLLCEALPAKGACWDSPVANYVSFTHNGKANALCFDGHVTAFQPTQALSYMVDGQF